MTYTCQICGRIFLSEDAYEAHLKDGSHGQTSTCPRCGGSGIISELFMPSYKCPECKGTGRIIKA